ncbi:YfaZ family outer membrane protein [Halioxenophilus aromaticivorans]|uniref:YfaZ n=1 Tax=Halioxenophilus aromaticivorans TaxID=1306992 RepID=A0AAV3U2W5_9ALTE
MKKRPIAKTLAKYLAALTSLALCPSLFSTGALAKDVSLRVGEEAVWVAIDQQLNETHASQLGLVFNSDDDINIVSGGLFATGQREQFSGRLGAKVYYADLDGDNGYGISLGGDLVFAVLPQLDIISGLYFGPSSISFSDVDRYEEWFIKARYQMFESGALTGGYGTLALKPDDGKDVKVDDGFFVEMSLRF